MPTSKDLLLRTELTGTRLRPKEIVDGPHGAGVVQRRGTGPRARETGRGRRDNCGWKARPATADSRHLILRSKLQSYTHRAVLIDTP